MVVEFDYLLSCESSRAFAEWSELEALGEMRKLHRSYRRQTILQVPLHTFFPRHSVGAQDNSLDHQWRVLNWVSLVTGC